MEPDTHGSNLSTKGTLGALSLRTPGTTARLAKAVVPLRVPRRAYRAFRPEPGYRRLSLFTRVILVNAGVLVGATFVFALTPATVSFPLAVREAIILTLGVVAIIAANAFLLRVTFRPLDRLVQLMRTIDLLQPGQRLEASGGVEVRQLIQTFNEMLERLERERSESNRRALTAREGERRRVGQELHDEIGQRLTGLLLQLGRALQDAPDGTRAQLVAMQHLVRTTLDEVGRMAWQLRPGILDDLGLVDSLRALADELDAPDGVRVLLAVDQPLPKLGSDADLVLYRIAQESITNALRHAEARRVAVELRDRGGHVTLQVADDGCGIDVAEEGPGIRGMRERALLVGAKLQVESASPGGVTVRLELPVQTGQS
jgi:two-component system sensor histidine kinase UhpB